MNKYEFTLIKQKENEYRTYIEEHVDNVQKAYNKLYKIILRQTDDKNAWMKNAILKLSRYIEYHDNSKYSTEEFNAYRRKFYPINDSEKTEKVDKDFQIAWQHHYMINPHHPLYWVKDGVAKNMSNDAILEMACDLIAMGMKFNNNPLDWFLQHADENEFNMSPKSKDRLIEILKMYGNE